MDGVYSVALDCHTLPSPSIESDCADILGSVGVIFWLFKPGVWKQWAPFPVPCNPFATSLGVRFLKRFSMPKV